MTKNIREKLLHHYFDRAFKVHRVFVYNKNHDLVAQIAITPEGRVTILQGESNFEKIGTCQTCGKTNVDLSHSQGGQCQECFDKSCEASFGVKSVHLEGKKE